MLLVGSDTPGAYQVTIIRASGHITFHPLLSYCLPSMMTPPTTAAAAGIRSSGTLKHSQLAGISSSSSSRSTASCPMWKAHTGLVTFCQEISFKCPPMSLVWGDPHYPLTGTSRHPPPKPRRSTAADEPLGPQPPSPALAAFGRGRVGTINESVPVSPAYSAASSRVVSPTSWAGGGSNKSWDYHQQQHQQQQQHKQHQLLQQQGSGRSLSLDMGAGAYGGGSSHFGSGSSTVSSSCYSPPGEVPTAVIEQQQELVPATAAAAGTTANSPWPWQWGSAAPQAVTVTAAASATTPSAATATTTIAATATANVAAAVGALHKPVWPGVLQSDMAATAGEECVGVEGRLPLLVTGGDDGSVAVWDLRGKTLGECWMVVHPHTGELEQRGGILLPCIHQAQGGRILNSCSSRCIVVHARDWDRMLMLMMLLTS